MMAGMVYNRDMEELILQFLLAKGVGDAAITKMLLYVATCGQAWVAKFACDANALQHELGMSAHKAQAVVGARDQAKTLWGRLIKANVNLVWKGSADYPALPISYGADAAPPVLFVRGNVRLLQKRGVGFCGSRHSSEKGLRIAESCSRQVVEAGYPVVSGYANGVDARAHKTAMSNGGETIIVLPEGILSYGAKHDIDALFSNENHLIVSQFSPDCRWFAHNAMRRNHLILSLSQAMVVVEAGKTGGSKAAGEAALERHEPLYVVQYQTPPESAEGNAGLIAKGGCPILQGKSGEPNLRKLMEAIDDQSNHATRKPLQMGLGI